MIWYTADTHLNHENIIRFCDRPFRTARHMDDVLVANLVAKVGPKDDLYVVGDFAFAREEDRLYILSRFEQVPGRKHLVTGNHDRAWARELPWASVSNLIELKDGGERVVLCHYPMITWNGARRGALQLFGHVHGNWRGSRNSVNVGVDVWGFAPVTLKEAQRRAATLPVNLHWADVEPRNAGEED